MDGTFREALSRMRKATQEMALGYFFSPHAAATQLNNFLNLSFECQEK